MEKITLNSIGKVVVRDGETTIELDKKYIKALTGLDGFSYIQVFWWLSDTSSVQSSDSGHSTLTENSRTRMVLMFLEYLLLAHLCVQTV